MFEGDYREILYLGTAFQESSDDITRLLELPPGNLVHVFEDYKKGLDTLEQTKYSLAIVQSSLDIVINEENNFEEYKCINTIRKIRESELNEDIHIFVINRVFPSLVPEATYNRVGAIFYGDIFYNPSDFVFCSQKIIEYVHQK